MLHHDSSTRRRLESILLGEFLSTKLKCEYLHHIDASFPASARLNHNDIRFLFLLLLYR